MWVEEGRRERGVVQCSTKCGGREGGRGVLYSTELSVEGGRGELCSISSVASGGAGGAAAPPHFSVPPGLSVHSRFLSVHSASLKILKK